MANGIPSGTVTFLFTDIEGSTVLAQQHRDRWEALRARHHAILRPVMRAHEGHVFEIVGDAFCVAFATAIDALKAAVDAQRALHAESWDPAPIRVRMGIHTGTAQFSAEGNGGYKGYTSLARAQRLMSAGHGGQVLVSLSTQQLVREDLPADVTLRDMGEQRLKDLVLAQRIYQLVVAGLPVDFPPLKTLDAYRQNLPAQLTTFVGREKEIAEIKEALAHHRLVSLTGSGGTGKTRLSLQVAADLLDQFPDGVWFVELAPLTDPELIPQTILSALEVTEQPGKTALQSLTEHLEKRSALLILDNCEHIIEASAKLVSDLLSKAHDLKVLTSSREALGVPGEVAWHVPSLSWPDVTKLPTAQRLLQYESVRLFVERASLAQSTFSLTAENAAAIAQICARLDGIPLAIELAAARVKALKVDQIAARLDDRFQLLTGGARTALPRQQTLRALIDWSYDLLTGNEKQLLRRLAVFAGGWTLEAAEQVCSDQAPDGILAGDVLDLLARLVDKSLVALDTEPHTARYQMLETTRQYAREKLFESGEGERLRGRHLEFFSRLAAQYDLHRDLPADADQVFTILRAEQDNFRAALQWAFDREPASLSGLVGALSNYWRWHSQEEGIQWMEHALSRADPGPSASQVRLMLDLAVCLTDRATRDRARQLASDALAMARNMDDRSLLAWATATFAAVLAEVENADAAVPYYEQAILHARETHNAPALTSALNDLGAIMAVKGEFALAEMYLQESVSMPAHQGVPGFSYVVLGCVALARGEIAKAREYIEAAIAAQGNAANRPLYWAHNIEMLGRIQIAEGDLPAARRSLKQGLTTLAECGTKPCLAHGLESYARLALVEHDPETAARFLAAGEAHLESLKMKLYAPEQLLYDQTLSAIRASLSEQEFASAWERGRGLKIEQALELALGRQI